MNRRDFLKLSSLASASLTIPSFLKPLSAFGLQNGDGFKRVVFIQLNGGNDGLNTVIPFRNDLYYKYRKNLGIPQNQVLRVSNNLSFNPNLKSLLPLFDNGDMAIINNVGYPEPNLSHFRSMDIWQTASNSNENVLAGWLGRLLELDYTNNPIAVIEVDTDISVALKGNEKAGFGFAEKEQFLRNVNQNHLKLIFENAKNEHQHALASYLYQIAANTNETALFVKEKMSTKFENRAEYPKSTIGKRLKTVADLMIAGAKTRVYFAQQRGFDSHIEQLNRHSKLLTDLGNSISAFANNLKQQNLWKETLVVVFSEFGRRVAENGSNGTDHGTANNILLFGGGLKRKGLLNELPDLSKLDNNGNLIHTIDFRQVYATILNNWLGVDDKRILLNRSFNKLNFV